MSEALFKLDAKTVNSMHTAIGALTFAITLRLPLDQRDEFSRSLARLAQSQNAAGDTTAGTMLLDYAMAAESAAKP